MSKRRPTRKQLEALLVEHGARIARVARALGVTRPTVYTWIYQLGLADRAGIRATPAPAPTDSVSCTVKLPGELWQWARVEAVMFDCSVSMVVEEALQALRGLRVAAGAVPTTPDARKVPQEARGGL